MKVKATKWSRQSVLLIGLLFLVAGVIPLSARVRPVALWTTPRVYVSPAQQEVLVGHNGFLEIRVDNVRDLYAVHIKVQHQPDIVDIIDAEGGEVGTQIGAGDIFDGLSWHVDYNQVDNETVNSPETIDYMFALDSSATAGVSGSGSLARIDFTGLEPGVSPFDFVEVILSDLNGVNIEHESENGQVRVVLIPSSPTPTQEGWISPTPTQTPMPAASSTPTSDGTITAPTTTLTPTCQATPTSTSSSPTRDPRPQPIVYIDPAQQTVLPGTVGWLDIMIDNAEDLYSAWVRLTYDPTVLAIQDSGTGAGTQIEPGDLFAGKAWYQVANAVDEGSRTITYGVQLSFNDPAGASGGQLARIHFQSLELGTCPFLFVDVVLADREGTAFAVESHNGEVHVSMTLPTPQSPTPTGSLTATPSATPTVTSTPTRVPTPIVFVDPAQTTMSVDGVAKLDIRVANVTNLFGVEFHIDYDPAILDVQDADNTVAGTQVGYGPFLSPESVILNHVDETAGKIHFAVSQVAAPARTGAGIVATFDVRAISTGATALALHTTELTDVFSQSMAHVALGGWAAVDTRVVVGHVSLQGRTNHAGVDIRQLGGDLLGETVPDGGFVFGCPVAEGQQLEIEASFPGYLPVTTTIQVPAGLVVDLGATMLPGGDVVGTQMDAARAEGCEGAPIVTMPGYPDGRINIIDLTFVGGHFGSSSADPDWEPSPDGCHPEWITYRADINGDSRCNIFDLVQVGNNFGLRGAQPW